MGSIAMLLFLFHLVLFSEIHTTNFTRRELLKYLTNLSTYDPNYPSGYDEGNVNIVKVQMDIFDLTSISDQNMEYSIMMLMRMQWRDDRLAYFKLANYSRLELTGDMIDMVWTPDLYISNERKTDAHTLVKHEELVYIDPKGVVSFSIRLSMTNYCYMDLKTYPFDVQTCSITIQSYAFTVDKIALTWYNNSGKFCDLKLPNYNVSVTNHTQDNVTNGDMSLTEGTFSQLKLLMEFERKSSAYGSMYFAPYPIFFVIAMTSFGFRGQNLMASRIILCTTGITTSVLQWIAIYARLPPVWYLTYLDGWIIFHVSIIGAILVYNAFWYMCVHKDKDKVRNRKNDNGQEMQNLGRNGENEGTNSENEGTNSENETKCCLIRNIELIAFVVFCLIYTGVCLGLLIAWA